MTFRELIERAAAQKPARMIVCGATDRDTATLTHWSQMGWQIEQREIKDDGATLAAIIEAARRSETDLLCIFSTSPATLIRDIEKALPREFLPLSWLHGVEIPSYPKTLWAGIAPCARYELVSDAIKSVQSMIRALQAFGISEPRVALLSCVEAISPSVPSTIWQAVLGHMGTRGQFGRAIVDGPMGLDLAINAGAAREKKFNSPVASEADLLVMPDLNTFVSFGQALALSGPQKTADLIVGGPCPILLTSPAAAEDANLSLAAATLLI